MAARSNASNPLAWPGDSSRPGGICSSTGSSRRRRCGRWDRSCSGPPNTASIRSPSSLRPMSPGTWHGGPAGSAVVVRSVCGSTCSPSMAATCFPSRRRRSPRCPCSGVGYGRWPVSSAMPVPAPSMTTVAWSPNSVASKWRGWSNTDPRSSSKWGWVRPTANSNNSSTAVSTPMPRCAEPSPPSRRTGTLRLPRTR